MIRKLTWFLFLGCFILTAMAKDKAKVPAGPDYRESVPFISATVYANGTTLKGLALKVGTKQDEATVCFDTELLRVSAGWTGGFIQPVLLMSRGAYPTNIGNILFSSDVTPGWVVNGKYGDPREDRRGPLPRNLAHYHGIYPSDAGPLLSYTIGGTEVLEHIESKAGVFAREFELAKHDRPYQVLVAQIKESSVKGGKKLTLAQTGLDAEVEGLDGASWAVHDGHLYLQVPAAKSTQKFTLTIGKTGTLDAVKFATVDLKSLTKPHTPRWPEVLTMKGMRGLATGAYAVDTLPVPFDNPWHCDMLIAGLDFFSDGRAAVSTFHGDVWIVSGIDDKLQKVSWKRYASGIYHALGLKIVNDTVYVLGRDQITRLHDLNNDGEADFYENFNNDVWITQGFHEFAFDLQTDAQGNFYFAKAGPVNKGGRGFMQIVRNHGTLMKVAKDGSKLEVIATGLRAPNGIGISPDGQLTTGDNEGTWVPRCRINWVKPGGFYGVVDTSHMTPLPTDYDRPLCWLPKEVDNSSGCQVWVTSDKWGPLKGQMLHLAYGTCSLYLVLKEEVNGQMQGGVVRLPVNFDSGIMRARFNAKDGQLYVAGMKGWQTSAAKNGCVQRVRYTGKPLNLPVGLHVTKEGVAITFSDKLDKELANDSENFAVSEWNYIWSSSYGSPEISVHNPASLHPGSKGTEWTKDQLMLKQHDTMTVKSAKLSADGKTVFLTIPDMQPVMQMQIRYNLETADGAVLRQEIFNTINNLGMSRN